MGKANKKPKSPTQEQMQILAEASGLIFDGGENEDRLFPDDGPIHTTSKDMSEEEYDAMEKDINSFSVQGIGFSVGAWNDCSGYDYWTIRQAEDNYIMITVYISDATKIDLAELDKAVEAAKDHFAHYSRY